MVLLQLQLFGHVGDHEGLTDGLSAGNTQRAVAVGVGPISDLHKASRGISSMARSTA